MRKLSNKALIKSINYLYIGGIHFDYNNIISKKIEELCKINRTFSYNKYALIHHKELITSNVVKYAYQLYKKQVIL